MYSASGSKATSNLAFANLKILNIVPKKEKCRRIQPELLGSTMQTYLACAWRGEPPGQGWKGKAGKEP